MFFSEMAYIGIDTSGGRKPYTWAALDQDCSLTALGDGDLEELMTFIGGQHSACVAVNAPSGINRGLVRQRLLDRSLALGQQTVRGADMRLAEFELRELGISVSGTPSSEERCPSWVQMGFAVYRKLSGLGYVSYPADENISHQWLETHPYAGYCALLGQIPLPKPTLEGRLQRQLALYDRQVGIKDPMTFFEEITRFKLLRGNLPVEAIYPPEVLDALVAAFTAYQAALRPLDVSFVGDTEEGQIVLPVRNLKSGYS